ncbi:MAG: DNA polymerase I [Flavobacteriales bacterium]|nr:DNA polymerase I [Flavobacteriales bacterium]
MNTKKRLFLIDAFALIFRGYYALIKNPRINSKGMDTSAILGFMNSLLDVIKREKPDHLAVAFDKGGSAARTEDFAAYKANRQETPEAIRLAIPYIHKILEAMEIPIIEEAGFEADDLIGTLAKQAEKEGYQTFMVTPDKDFAQLVSENIFMYKPARMGNGIEIWGVDKVKERFEIEDPLQVIDFLGMMGDASDNIPGLPGVGEKTAKKFLKEYGSMENLLANAHEIKGKLGEKIEANKELGMLSKKLATIMLDCPVTFHEENFKMSQPNFDKVSTIFQELEFRRMAEQFVKIFGVPKTEPISADSQKTPEISKETVVSNTITKSATAQLDLFSFAAADDLDTQKTNPHFYQYVDTALARQLLLSKLLQQKTVAISIKTADENALQKKCVAISFSFEANKGYYINLPQNTNEATTILNIFKPFFESLEILKIGQDLKFLTKLLAYYNLNLKGSLFDIKIAHYLINPDVRHDKEILAAHYLNYSLAQESQLLGKGKTQKNLSDLSLTQQADFCTEEASLFFQLQPILEKELEDHNLLKLYKNIEIKLLPVLAKMELEGVKLDIAYLKSLSAELQTDISALEKSIFETAGEDFNLASPKQLGIVLFENLKLVDKPKKTKTGQYATGEEVLSKLATTHPIVADILNWRGLIKLQNTYVDALPNEVNPNTKRIHTTFAQTVAATGRLSSISPNLQNIPIRTERGKQVRKAFIPRDENHILLAADYSQIELRLIAEMSGDTAMKESFLNGEDIHKATAANVFNVPLNEVTQQQRSHAKTVNFGIIYGVSAFGLSQQTNLSRTESKDLIEAYYQTYPTLKTFISNQIDFAKEHGYVETLLGRRRYLKNINSHNSIVRAADERNAVNAPIQGSAADIIKIAMINIDKRLIEEKHQSKMLLQVHDELIFDVYKPELDQLTTIIKHEMENAYKLSIPLIVDIGTGNNWLEAH